MHAHSPGPPPRGGAYILHLRIAQDLALEVGALGRVLLPAGRYAYIGSARSSLAGRVARHRRLAASKSGTMHWHIDYVLAHPAVSLARVESLPGCEECEAAQRVARRPGASAPVPRFGATDCRSGCAAHLFRVGSPAGGRGAYEDRRGAYEDRRGAYGDRRGAKKDRRGR